jgi:hypothetical protein
VCAGALQHRASVRREFFTPEYNRSIPGGLESVTRGCLTWHRDIQTTPTAGD